MTVTDATVVVPVYNPGSAIDPCIASLLAQTLPAERLQIIFCDDGSTDGSGDKLDRLAAEHAHVQVIHLPNSGWPGRPRNLGIEAATGEYIQFVDHDDRLGAQALERLVAYGRANSADIVAGRVSSNFREIPEILTRANLERCSVWDSDLILSLTPHKMFRRAFLIDSGIRFPEGKVRLEDNRFVLQAYFAAATVSVLADYPCYYWWRRSTGTNSSDQLAEPAFYYRFVREVLDIAVANTEPGSLRTSIYRRYLHIAVQRCGTVAASPPEPGYLEKLHAEVVGIWDDYLGDQVAAGLASFQHAQAVLVRQGSLERLATLTTAKSLVKPDVRLDAWEWTGTAWRARVTARMTYEDGTPLTVVRSGQGWRPDPRIIPLDVGLPPESLDTILGLATSDVVVRHRDSAVSWFAPGRWTHRFEPASAEPDGPAQLVATGVIDLDPTTLALGSPLTAGTWDVLVNFYAYGIRRQVRLGIHSDAEPDLTPALFRPRARLVTPRLSPTGKLCLAVRAPAPSLSAALARRVTEVSVADGTLVISAGLRLIGGRSDGDCAVRIGDTPVAATLEVTATGMTVRSRPASAARLPQGRSGVSIIARAGEDPEPVGVVTVGRRGRLSAASP